MVLVSQLFCYGEQTQAATDYDQLKFRCKTPASAALNLLHTYTSPQMTPSSYPDILINIVYTQIMVLFPPNPEKLELNKQRAPSCPIPNGLWLC